MQIILIKTFNEIEFLKPFKKDTSLIEKSLIQYLKMLTILQKHL